MQYGSNAPQLKKSSYIHSSGYIPPSQQISTLSPFKQSQPVNSNASSGQLTEFIHKNQRKQKVCIYMFTISSKINLISMHGLAS